VKKRISLQTPPYWVPAQFNLPAALATALAEAAVKSVRAAAQTIRRARRPRRGETLKPGRATPLWNELANAVEAQIAKRGEKARLARVLGLPRQRVQDLLRARRHLPDAERTLLLLVWLQTRRAGGDLA
jgi:hypothetical protein